MEIYTTPNTGNGPWNKGYQPSGIQDPIRAAALELVEVVEMERERKMDRLRNRIESYNKHINQNSGTTKE